MEVRKSKKIYAVKVLSLIIATAVLGSNMSGVLYGEAAQIKDKIKSITPERPTAKMEKLEEEYKEEEVREQVSGWEGDGIFSGKWGEFYDLIANWKVPDSVNSKKITFLGSINARKKITVKKNQRLVIRGVSKTEKGTIKRYKGSENYEDAIFEVENGGELVIQNMILSGNNFADAEKSFVEVKKGGKLTVSGSSFKDIMVFGHGGAITNQGGAVILKNSEFYRCNVGGVVDIDEEYGGCGGAVFNTSNGVVTIKDSAFAKCTSINSGGAICNTNALILDSSNVNQEVSTINISNTSFAECNTLDSGKPGLAIRNINGILNLTRCSFEKNNSETARGVISNSGILNIQGGVFQNNITGNTHGSAIVSDAKAILEGVGFKNNYTKETSVNSSAVLNSGDRAFMTLENCNLSNAESDAKIDGKHSMVITNNGIMEIKDGNTVAAANKTERAIYNSGKLIINGERNKISGGINTIINDTGGILNQMEGTVQEGTDSGIINYGIYYLNGGSVKKNAIGIRNRNRGLMYFGGGTIQENVSHGITNKGSMEHSAGTIESNQGYGGYQDGSYFMSSDAYVKPDNVVFLCENRCIQVTARLNYDNVARICSEVTKAGTVLVKFYTGINERELTQFTTVKEENEFNGNVVKEYFNSNLGTDKYEGKLLFRNPENEKEIIISDRYLITYHANGGKGTVKAQDKYYHLNINLNENRFEKARHEKSEEWNTDEHGGGSRWKEGEAYSENADVRLYAQWEPWRFWITYVCHKPSGVDGEMESEGERQLYKVNSIERIPNIGECEDAKFVGWCLAKAERNSLGKIEGWHWLSENNMVFEEKTIADINEVDAYKGKVFGNILEVKNFDTYIEAKDEEFMLVGKWLIDVDYDAADGMNTPILEAGQHNLNPDKAFYLIDEAPNLKGNEFVAWIVKTSDTINNTLYPSVAVGKDVGFMKVQRALKSVNEKASLSTREKELIGQLKDKNIVCWKLDTAGKSDSVLFAYNNDWNTVNGNHYYKTANYTASDLKGNLYTYEGDFSFDTGKKGYQIAKVTFEQSPLSGKTVYFNVGENNNVTNPCKIKLTYADGTSEEAEMKLSYNQEYVYEYTFPEYVLPGTECQFSADGGTTYVPENKFNDVAESTPCYNLNTDTWEEFTPEIAEVKIFVTHSFTTLGGARVIFTKNGTAVPGLTYDIGTSSGFFLFDFNSSEYDGFYIKQRDDSQTGNTTVIASKSEIETAVKTYSVPLIATVGGWINTATPRELTFGKYVSIPDQSLNIPEGTFTKEDNILYAKSTFYDYYSDYELTGKNRNTLSGGFNQTPGSDDKMQARKLNNAISEYFKDSSLATSTNQSPLYFGEFTGANTSGLLNFIFQNNNGEQNKYNGVPGAKQGLVNASLVDNQLVMGTENIAAPYFNKEFLRGNNATGGELGYVFENVEFPFVMNDTTGYWEFNSYDSADTLRMKQEADGTYFLDRVGADNAVKGFAVTAATSDSNFFPFNGKEESGNGKKLNYAFGARIEIPFYMTSNGKVTMESGEKDISFQFRGDDDVWIFIDNELILDIGGDHGAVEGKINFADLTATTMTSKGENVKKFTRLEPKVQHTLTMFYMERGIWESNMYMSFNFPQSNKLDLEKEVVIPTGLNPTFDFIKEILQGTTDKEAKTAFPIAIKNMVTSGQTTTIQGDTPAVEYDVDEITENTKASFYSAVSGAVNQITSGGTRDNILKYFYPGEKKLTDGQNVTDKRSVLIDYAGTGNLNVDTEQIKHYGYIEFDAYLDANASDGAPFVALIDINGNRVGAWTTQAVYSGTNGNMKSKTWTTLKMYLNKLYSIKKLDGTASGTFDYGNIKQIQFAHWDDTIIYLDNFSVKAPAIYTQSGGFIKDQDAISDYGSYVAKELMPVSGAAYVLNPEGDGEEETYSYTHDGLLYLKHGDLAIFKDQFRRESYLSVVEQCDSKVFKTDWTLYEDGEERISGSGLAVEDNRIEMTPENAGVTKPSESTILFKGWDNSESITSFFELKVKYTNTLRLGNLTVKKEIVNGQAVSGETYKIRVIFSNVAGMALEGEYQTSFEPTIEAEIEVGKPLVIEGIPAGTKYRIEEIKEAGDEYRMKGMSAAEGGNDVGSFDEAAGIYSGIVTADDDGNKKDIITVTNDLKATVNVSGRKEWIGNAEPEPNSITLQLQCKLETQEDTEYVPAKDADGNLIGEYVVLNGDWTFSIPNLPKYQISDKGRQKYVYRVVETKINDKDISKINTGYTVSGGLENQAGEYIITNTYTPTNLEVTKVDAEDNTKVIAGVKFRLEKLINQNGTWVVDQAFYSPDGYIEAVTDDNGVLNFEHLADGRYRLTEVKSQAGYNLLANEVLIEINRLNGCKVDGEDYTIAVGSDTISVKISNQLELVLPFTGSNARTIMVGFGILLSCFGVIFSLYNLKSFKKERQNRRKANYKNKR